MARPFVFYHVDFPRRDRPAEHIPGRGWQQDGRRRRVKKPYYHFIWPKDGRNGSKAGRWKDILGNKGPDVHVTIGADKNDYMHNRQRRSRWSRHANLDDRGPDGALQYQFPWVKSRRQGGQCYDFRTRKYGRPRRDMWTDAYWHAEPDRYFDYPYAIRDVYGEWYQDGANGRIW